MPDIGTEAAIRMEIIIKEAEGDAHNKAGNALENISGELNSTGLLAEGIANYPSSGKLKKC